MTKGKGKMDLQGLVKGFVPHLQGSRNIEFCREAKMDSEAAWYEVQEDDDGNRFFIYSTDDTFPLYEGRLYFAILLNTQRYDIPLVVARQSSGGHDARIQAVAHMNFEDFDEDFLLDNSEGLILTWVETIP